MTELISKALIINRPWIDMILNGEKIWEMRSQATSLRGWIGLIEKGTGQVVGVAKLIDCLPPLDRVQMLTSVGKHGIPDTTIRDGAVDNWHTPWVLASARRLFPPVRYRHPPGAVIWVNLDAEVSQAIREALESQGIDVATNSGTTGIVPAVKTIPLKPANAPSLSRSSHQDKEGAGGVLIGESVLTEGNLNNNHFYLGSYLHLFPADAIGGSNRASVAPRTLLLDWGGHGLVETDIAGDKKIFRERGWAKSFFIQNEARPGDKVRVFEMAPYQYEIQFMRG